MDKEIHFGVTGEFITQVVREWFYSGKKSIDKIMEILVDCMAGTDTPESQIKRYAEDILIGRAALKGSTADGTYHLEMYDPGEEEKLPRDMDIWKIPQLRQKIEKQLDRMQDRFLTAMDHLPESEQRKVRRELGEETSEDRDMRNIDSFISRMIDEGEHTTADYGWLEPNGTFHEVEWGEHTKWADDYIRNYPSEEWMKGGFYNAGDYLVQKGWVLLHNPAQGIAIPTKDPSRRYTKAQRDFLYGYYADRDCTDKANEIMEGSE